MPNPTPLHAGDPVLAALGGAIKAIRKQRGVSQETLALHSGVERAYVSGIERGAQNLTVMTLAKIAAVLDVSLSEVMLAAKI